MPSSLQLYRINPINPTTSAALLLDFDKSESKPTWVCRVPSEPPVLEDLLRHHTHRMTSNQCCSIVVQAVDAPIAAVWSFVRRFDNPHAYKRFLKSCHIILDGGEVGTIREVTVVSGLPAATNVERLEMLDDGKHIMSFSEVGGDHRLQNYMSVTTLHEESTFARDMTVVVESYVADVSAGNTEDVLHWQPSLNPSLVQAWLRDFKKKTLWKGTAIFLLAFSSWITLGFIEQCFFFFW